MLKVTFLLVGLLLTACASVTENIDEFKLQLPNREFVVEQNYQTVYRIIASGVRRCYMSSEHVDIQADLYPDIKSGEVVVQLFAVSHSVNMVANIEAVGNSTLVKIRHEERWGPAVNAIEGWVRGTTTECRLKV